MSETNKKTEKSSTKAETTKVESRDEKESRRRQFKVTRDLLINTGPLQVPESVKRPGYSYFWMRCEKYRIEKYRRMGYDFVYDEHGNVVRGGYKDNAMFLLDIPNEIKEQLDAIKDEMRKEETQLRNQLISPDDKLADGVYVKEFSNSTEKNFLN